MTLRGLFVCLFELFLIILALGTEIEEFFTVAICVAGMIAFSLFSLVLASLTLRVDSRINKKSIIRNDKLTYTLILQGVALLPVVAYLSLKTTEAEFDARSRKRHSFVLLPTFSLEHKFVFEIPAVHVGNWEIGIKKMRFEDMFGLFAFPLIKVGKTDFSVDLAVMPKVYRLNKNGENLSSGGYGNTSLKNSEEGDLLGDSRLYKDGDSLKRINWKLSARTKTIYSRQYEAPQKPKVAIVVDNAIAYDFQSNAVDIICETAVSLLSYFLSYNNEVDIISLRGKRHNESKVYELREYSDLYKMQYNLSYFEFYKNDEPLTFDLFDDVLLSAADRIYLISTNPSDDLLSDFADLNKTGKIARCFVPEMKREADFSGLSIDVASADEISQTVGEAI